MPLIFSLLTLALAGPHEARSPTESEWTQLQAGQVVTSPLPDLDPPGALAFVEIQATPDQVWAALNDPEETVEGTPSVTACTRYKLEQTATGQSIGLHYVLSVAWTEIEYLVLRDLRPAEGWMTWTLDPDKDSDLVHTSGTYRVLPGRSPDHQLLVYVSQVDSGRRVPAAISNFLTGRALKTYLGHVQTIAEQ